MENRYYVKIRLFDNLPDMPEHGVYKTIMVESDSTEEVTLCEMDETLCKKTKQIVKILRNSFIDS